MKLQRTAALLCLLVCSSTQAEDPAPEPVPSWLNRMLTAANTLNYSGISVYMGDGPLQSTRVIHRVGVHGDEVHTITLNGEHREVQRYKEKVVQIYPNRKLIIEGLTWANPFALALPKDPTVLLPYYAFQEIRTDRVAGRPCLRTAVLPKDDYRFGYRLCLDKETGLLLDAQLLDHDGSIRQQVLFTEVKIGQPIPPSELRYHGNLKGYQHRSLQPPQDRDRLEPMAEQWQVTQLPPGFKMTGSQQQYPLERDVVATHLILSDGLASISIFITRPTSATAIFSGDTRHGSLNAYGLLRDGYQIVVIGEAPYKTLELIGQSIRPARPSS